VSSHVEFTETEISFLKRGLISLEGDIIQWMRGRKTWLFGKRENAHSSHGASALARLETILSKLDSITFVDGKETAQPSNPVEDTNGLQYHRIHTERSDGLDQDEPQSCDSYADDSSIERGECGMDTGLRASKICRKWGTPSSQSGFEDPSDVPCVGDEIL
jgi:hypothetical protein